MLLRLVDDYLLVTTNYSKAMDFLEMMMKGRILLRHDLLGLGLMYIAQGILNMAVSSHTRRQGLTLSLSPWIHR